MIIYPSVKELVEELEPGSVVVVPSELLSVLSRHLNLKLLEIKHGDTRLFSSPFYVFDAPTLHRMLRLDRYGVKVESEFSPEANLADKVKAKVASLKSTVFWERRNIEVVHTALADESYVRYVSENISKFSDKFRYATAGKPIFISLKSPTVENVELLSRVGTVNGIPTFVMIPIRLSSPYMFDAKLVKELMKRGHSVAVLLGVDPESIKLMTKKKIIDYPTTYYLIRNIISDTLPIEARDYRNIVSDNITSAVVDKLLRLEEQNTGLLPPRPEEYYSINTVFLNSLVSVSSRRLRTYLEEYHNKSSDEIGDFLVNYGMMQASREKKVLAWYAENVGASEEIVNTILSSEALIEPYSFLGERVRERSREEELLYTHRI